MIAIALLAALALAALALLGVAGVLVLAAPTPEQRRRAEQDRGLDLDRTFR